jgi:hypothetical protein
MYVRKKQVRKGIGTWDKPWKVYDYWQVVRSTRVDGKPRQKVVAYVGAAEDREHADRIARSNGLLCGVVGCGEAGTEEEAGLMLERSRKVERQVLMCARHVSEFRAGAKLTVVPLPRE